MRISDWSSDVCSSDLPVRQGTRLCTELASQEVSVWLVLDIFGVKCEALHIRCPFFRLNGFLSFFYSHVIFLFVLSLITIISTLREARINFSSTVEGSTEKLSEGKTWVGKCKSQ